MVYGITKLIKWMTNVLLAMLIVHSVLAHARSNVQLAETSPQLPPPSIIKIDIQLHAILLVLMDNISMPLYLIYVFLVILSVCCVLAVRLIAPSVP